MREINNGSLPPIAVIGKSAVLQPPVHAMAAVLFEIVGKSFLTRTRAQSGARE